MKKQIENGIYILVIAASITVMLHKPTAQAAELKIQEPQYSGMLQNASTYYELQPQEGGDCGTRIQGNPCSAQQLQAVQNVNLLQGESSAYIQNTEGNADTVQ
jgi:hypothetical protein